MQDQIKWEKIFDLKQSETKEKQHSSIACSVNGKFVLASFDNSLEIINSESGISINKIPTIHKNGIKEICISQYGNYFLTIGGLNKVVLWDGSTLEPIKKFQIATKTELIKFVGFNKNETTVFIVSEIEIVVFKINPEDLTKQLLKTQLKDRTIEGACLLDKQGALITADNLQFISIYDVNNLVRVNLTQKLSPVNVIRQFDSNQVWFAFQNNTIVVYQIEENEIKFDSFEKKLPFEVLEIQKYNSELYLVSGFDNRIGLINKEGHFIKFVCQFDNAILIRKFKFNQQTNFLFIISDQNQLSTLSLDLRPQIQIQDSLWVKIINVSQIELSFINHQNIGLQDSYDNYVITINGQILSVGYNQSSYLVILFQTSVSQKIRLIDSQKIIKNINEMDVSDILDYEQIQSQPKRESKTLKIQFSENMEQIYCTAAALLFQSSKGIIMTDFELNTLRSWEFNSPISFVHFRKGLKRKENILVALQHGELLKVSLDNTFPVTLLDYKVEILFFQQSLDKTHFLIIDKNQNLVIFKYNPEELSMSQIYQQSQVVSARFNESKNDLLFYITSDNKMTLRFLNKYQSSQNNQIDLENEEILLFEKNQILVKKKNNIDMRVVTVFTQHLINELISDKDFENAYDLLMKLQIQDQQEFMQMALTSFATLEPISHQIIKQTNDLQLLHLSKEIQLKQREDKSFPKEVILAEMLCYEGKYQKGIDLLLNNNLISEAIEMLMVLGKYEQAIKILKNPQYKKLHKSEKYSFNSLVKMQAFSAKTKGEYQLAYELFMSIQQYDEMVKILIEEKKDLDLINLIRSMDFNPSNNNSIDLAFQYFKESKQIPFAKECLMKQGNMSGLLDLYIEFEMFQEALELYEKISKHQVIDPSRVFLPYAGILMRDNKFEEALDKYKKIGKLDFCVKALSQFIKINKEIKNYFLVSKFIYEKSKLQQTLKQGYPIEALFYLLLNNFIDIQNTVVFEKQMKELVLRSQVNLLIIAMNIYDEMKLKTIRLNLTQYVNQALECCSDLQLYNKANFLINKMMELDSQENHSLRWRFLKNAILNREKKTDDYLYICYQCGFKGVQMNGLNCSNCQMKQYFCYLSGQQLPIIEIKFSTEINIEQVLDLDNFKLFDQSEKILTNKWKSQEEIIDPAQQFLQKQYEYQQEKGCLFISSLMQLQKLKFKNFCELNEQIFFYKFQDQNYFLICEDCHLFYSQEAFEIFYSSDSCQNCKAKNFALF